VLALLIGLSACSNNAAQLSYLEADGDIAAPAEPAEPAEQEEPTPLPEVDIELELEPEPEPEPTEIDPEVLTEIVELLSGIEHPGVDLSIPLLYYNHTGLEGLGLDIANFINNINGFWGPPRESFLTPENAPFLFAFWPAYLSTPRLQWRDPEGENYHPELSMLEPYLNQNARAIMLRAHMEDTAKALFGAVPDMSHEPFAGRDSTVFGEMLVDGPLGMPTGDIDRPVVLGYEHIGDGFYEVSCVFVSTFEGLYHFADGGAIPDDELIDFLHTLPRHTITLRRNEAGGFYYYSHILPGDDLPTVREVRELLLGTPHPGMRERSGNVNDWSGRSGATSETAARLLAFIHIFNHAFSHPPLTSFESPEDASPEFVFSATFFETNTVQWTDPSWVNAVYHPELHVLRLLMNPVEGQLTLHIHMEETARILFGRELEIHPPAEPTWPYIVFDWLGGFAYSIEGFGLTAGRWPYILSYEDTGDGYEVRVVFYWYGIGGFSPERMEEGQIGREWRPGDELEGYLRTTTDIHTITLLRNAAGGFYYHAHILPEGWGEDGDENG